ncbi:MAG: DUF4040 domain-containing protein [Desulfurococcaceae archaeon]|nr:DUF4040 domain-containing protein [Desulfurococcaceae archaeon]
MEPVAILLATVAALLSVIATYLAIEAEDLLVAVVFSAVQSTAYALLYYVFMAPDIVLVYVPVSVGLLPAVTVLLVKKTERYER